MVKRAPLRKKVKEDPAGSAKIQKTDASSSAQKRSKKQKGLHVDTKAGENLDEDEDAYWERIEKEAEGKAQRSSPAKKKAVMNGDGDKEAGNGESDDSSSDEEESEDEGINITDKVEHISEEFTFEFNDMRPAFTEGICTLLKAKFVANPTSAYDVACAITAQAVVGTAIVCEGENDVFAFATMLPLFKHREGPIYAALQQLAKDLPSVKNKNGDNTNTEALVDCLTGLKEKST